MTEKKTLRFESEVLGLPPLKMVLVHVKDDNQPTENDPLLAEKSEESDNKEQAVRRLIEHLNKKS